MNRDDSDRAVRKDVNDKYFAEWQHPGSPARQLYNTLVSWRYERRVRTFGYSLREPHVLRAPAVMLPGLGEPAADERRAAVGT